MSMRLKPQDIVVALKLVAIGEEKWTYVQLCTQLYISSSEINAGIKRLERASIVTGDSESRTARPRIVDSALGEFLVHGVKYAFPAERGELTRGMPTSYAAPPLSSIIVKSKDPPPVWPDKESKVRGYSLAPC